MCTLNQFSQDFISFLIISSGRQACMLGQREKFFGKLLENSFVLIFFWWERERERLQPSGMVKVCVMAVEQQNAIFTPYKIYFHCINFSWNIKQVEINCVSSARSLSALVYFHFSLSPSSFPRVCFRARHEVCTNNRRFLLPRDDVWDFFFESTQLQLFYDFLQSHFSSHQRAVSLWFGSQREREWGGLFAVQR